MTIFPSYLVFLLLIFEQNCLACIMQSNEPIVIQLTLKRCKSTLKILRKNLLLKSSKIMNDKQSIFRVLLHRLSV